MPLFPVIERYISGECWRSLARLLMTAEVPMSREAMAGIHKETSQVILVNLRNTF